MTRNKKKKILKMLLISVISVSTTVCGQEDVQYIVGSRITVYEKGDKINQPEDCYNWTENVLTFTDFYEDSNQVYDYTVMTFDDGGQLIEEKAIDGEDDSQDYLYRYEYDQNGKLVKESSHNANNDVIEYTIYGYNSSGDLTKEEGFDGFDNETYLSAIEYDEKGRKYKTENSGTNNYSIYEYDEEDRIISITTHWFGYDYYSGEETESTSEHTYTYDDMGRLKDEYESLTSTTTVYFYDEEGNMWWEWQYDSVGNQNNTVYVYDETGNVVEKVEERNVAFGKSQSNTFRYDRYGNITYESHKVGNSAEQETQRKWEYNSDNKPIKCFLGDAWEEWEYDSLGNEIKYTYFYKDGTIRDQVITEWIEVPQYVVDVL